MVTILQIVLFGVEGSDSLDEPSRMCGCSYSHLLRHAHVVKTELGVINEQTNKKKRRQQILRKDKLPHSQKRLHGRFRVPVGPVEEGS